jgi:hypothetical protein
VKRFVSLQFLNLTHSIGLLGRMMYPSQGRYLTQTSMPRMGFERTIPAFDRTKTVHALDRAATMIGITYIYLANYERSIEFWADIYIQRVGRT